MSHTRETGLTLVELLIVSTILVMLFGAILSTSRVVTGTINTSDRRSDVLEATNRAMQRVGELVRPGVLSTIESRALQADIDAALAGGDLARHLSAAPQHRLSLGEALRVAGQIAEGLDHAHRAGVVHGDLSPVNVWRDTSGDAKLADFGLGLSASRSHAARPATGSGDGDSCFQVSVISASISTSMPSARW